MQGKKIPFATFLQNLLKLDRVLICKKLGEHKYQLTYSERIQRIFSNTHEIPDHINDELPWVVNATVTFAKDMTIEIVTHEEYDGLIFSPQAIKATKKGGFPFTRTTFLQEIRVYKQPNEKGSIFIKAAYCFAFLRMYQEGFADHQQVVDILSLLKQPSDHVV